MQKLKMSFFHLLESLFTCFLKDKTLHNHWDYAGFTVPYYNIPSNNRELQRSITSTRSPAYYNIPSNNRELQLSSTTTVNVLDYNIPSNNRELQLTFLMFVLILYYNIPSNNRELQPTSYRQIANKIITYQVITGNYSRPPKAMRINVIITYQVITGNYSRQR